MDKLVKGLDKKLKNFSDLDLIRIRCEVEGIVQGVGFRPFVYKLARNFKLVGLVTNTSFGVLFEVEGLCKNLCFFFQNLILKAPPLSSIVSLKWFEEKIKLNEKSFIIKSSHIGLKRTLISPDVCVCDECLKEMLNANDKRYKYPFINCTNCGPRYSIIKDLPYDRPFTTMGRFQMCFDCQFEYDNPNDRRFHAQPNACLYCGPKLRFIDFLGREILGNDPVDMAVQALKLGEIVGIKGLGGSHLMVDATNDESVNKLRKRKKRNDKPLALMVSSLEKIDEIVLLEGKSKDFLVSRERPIVICRQKSNRRLSPRVNPGTSLLGVMLPYTPLHSLIMKKDLNFLVMTSANLAGEPICLTNDEFLSQNRGTQVIADKFVVHDRKIYIRSDDSVVKVVSDKVCFVRRSRGYVPKPLFISKEKFLKDLPPVLATGGHLKNTVCFLIKYKAFVSQHIGNLENEGVILFFQFLVKHLVYILGIEPRIIACDYHPNYFSTEWALAFSKKRKISLVKVQHHHAHIVAVMAENKISGPVLGLSLDGTGYGLDNTIWGGELLKVDYYDCYRIGHLLQFHLPGGDAAVGELWRGALGVLLDLYGKDSSNLELKVVNKFGRYLDLIYEMKRKKINTPITSSLGRLFDIVACLCGLCFDISYEGQAAVLLEQFATMTINRGSYHFKIIEKNGVLILDWKNALRELIEDVLNGVNLRIISSRFHLGLTTSIISWVSLGVSLTGLSQVCLSGGCFLNNILFSKLYFGLKNKKIEVFIPNELPVGDGGISLGQAFVAAARSNRNI